MDCIKGIVRQKVYFPSNLIFWVGMGGQRGPKYFVVPITLFWGGMFGPSEPNDPIPTQNMRFEAKYFFLAEDLFNEAATNMNYAALYVK